MAATSSSNIYEKSVATLARNNVNVYDYWILEDGKIISLSDVNFSPVDDLKNYFNVSIKRANLNSLLNRVKYSEEASYDQDTKDRMCAYVMKKFQNNIGIEKEKLEKKEHELACQRAEVKDLLDDILPIGSDTIQNSSDLSDQVNQMFDHIENEAKRNFGNNNDENCSTAARKHW